MKKYRCTSCGYEGEELVYSFTDYGYCMATNSDDPDYVNEPPDWVKEKGYGEAEIGEPVGCPKCRVWGVHNFEIST